MLESGFNQTEFGKGILGACFINDLGTVIALGVLFAPFTYRTVIFIVVTVLVLGLLPVITARLTAWTVTGRPPFEPSGFCLCYVDWVRWPFGREARPCCRRISPESCWPRTWAETISISGGCEP
jgi:hypothetical protein